MNPVEIDALFQETNQLLAISPSERVKLDLIDSFLKVVEGKEKVYGSYIEQLITHIPAFSQPLLYTGIDPEKLLVFIRRLEQFEKVVEKTEIRVEVREKINLYIEIAGVVQGWLGESPDEKTLQKDLVKLERAPKRTQQEGVLVPVVEELGGRKTGRLRRVQVEMIGPSKNGNQLKPTFGVIGGDAATFLKPVERAVTKFVEETISRSHKHWMASIHFESGQAWHAGGSANLAIAGCYYSEILKAEEQQELFWLNPTAVITGELDGSGSVLPVNKATLQLKIEAAFFSWAQILVVPKDQLNSATKFIHQLQQRYPNRHLPVMGVSHLKELFYDRRTVLYKKETTLTHGAKKVWKRKFSAGSIALIIILLLIIGRLVVGPVDRNPVLAKFDGEMMFIKNQAGITLLSKKVGEGIVNSINNPFIKPSYNHVQFYDINGDGINELIEKSVANKDFSTGLNLFAYNLSGDTLWVSSYELDIRFDQHPYVQEEYYHVLNFEVVDIDKDGVSEIAAILGNSRYFAYLFVTIDIESGEIKTKYINAGDLRDFYVIDLDRDEINEVIISTFFKGYEGVGLVILDSRFLDGVGIMGERYAKTDYSKASEKVAILLPQTKVGQIVSQNSWHHYGYPGEISIRNDSIVSYYHYESFTGDKEGNASVLYEFNSDLSVRSVVSADDYDAKAQQLYQERVIEKIPTAVDVFAYKDSIKYWNGNTWVDSLITTMNYPNKKIF